MEAVLNSNIIVVIICCYFFLIFMSILSCWCTYAMHLHLPEGVEVAQKFTVFFLIMPFIILGFILVQAIRIFISIHFKIFKNGILQLMDSNDAYWASEDPTSPSITTTLIVLQGKLDIRKVITVIKERVMETVVDGEKIYKKLALAPTTRFGFYCWEYVEAFDINNHVRIIDELEEKHMTETDILLEIPKIQNSPLSHDRPLWELLLIPKYVYPQLSHLEPLPDYYAALLRFHHCYMDGISACFLFQNGLSDNPPKYMINPFSTSYKTTFLRRVLDFYRTALFGPRILFREMFDKELNIFREKPLTGSKILGMSKSIPFNTLRNIKDETNSSIISILGTALGGALRNLATKHGEEFPQMMKAVVALPVFPYPNTKPQNRFSFAFVPLDTSENIGVARLQTSSEYIFDTYKSPVLITNFIFMKAVGYLPVCVSKLMSKTAQVTVAVTNLPGPSEACYLFGGDKITDIAVWTPAGEGIGIGLDVFSYNGFVRVTITGDAASIRDSSDMSDLINWFQNEILEMSMHKNFSFEP